MASSCAKIHWVALTVGVTTLSVAVLPGVAHGQVPAGEPGVHVVVDPCTQSRAREVADVVEMELDIAVEYSAQPSAAVTVGKTVASVRCEDAVVVFAVDDAVTGKTLVRRVDEQRIIANGRSRLLGLILAELVAASWLELESTLGNAVAPRGRDTTTATRTVARDRARARLVHRRPWNKTLLGTLRIGSSLRGTEGGLGFGLVLDGPNHWGLSARAAFEQRSESAGGASANVVATAITTSLGLHLHTRLAFVEARVGVRARVGSAQSPSFEQGGRWFAAGVVDASVATVAFSRVALELGIELDYDVIPIEAALSSGPETITFSRAHIVGQVAVGVRW